MFIVIGYKLDDSDPTIFGLYKTLGAAQRRVEQIKSTYETTPQIEEIAEGACDILICAYA